MTAFLNIAFQIIVIIAVVFAAILIVLYIVLPAMAWLLIKSLER